MIQKANVVVRYLVCFFVLLSLAMPAFSEEPATRRPSRRQRQLTDQQKQQVIEDLNKLVADAEKDKLIAPDQIDRAIAILNDAPSAFEPDELYTKISRLEQYLSDTKYPMPKKPLKDADKLDRQLMSTQIRCLKQMSPEKVPAHPAAAGFPGSVPQDAETISKTIEIRTDVPGWHNNGIYGNPESNYWHSTGLYARPGGLIVVTAPQAVADRGLQVRIGCHSDRLNSKNSWSRAPDICTRSPVTSAETKAANAFGGLIYIESPGQLSIEPFTVTITGAMPAPHYIHGKTTLDEWKNTIRNNPAPWAELETKKVILTLPSDEIRKLDDPKALMDFWDGIMDYYAELLGKPLERRRPERFVPDIQISAGYMHSGYPLMTMLDITGTMVDKERIKNNAHHGVWGLFHEIGHNHQDALWVFNGTTEVTVNLFSLYVMEKVCGFKIGGHPAVEKSAREKAMTKYIADGADFEKWKSDPFLALAMYIQMQQAFGWDSFCKTFGQYRQLTDDQKPKSDDDKRDQWLVRYSKTVGKNLGPFFDAWGVPVSEQAKKSIADLPSWMPDDMPDDMPAK